VIISASRRTDIPAFYSEWFMNRVKDGFFCSINPFNRKKVKAFSLSPRDVDVIVFWSKNPKPLIRHLDLLESRGYNYYFQFTLNDYPKIFEPNVPSIEERIETFRELSEKIGKKRVIWRYDPIIISSITDINYHLDKIYNISNKLNAYTERLVISFLDFYGKVKNRLKKLMKLEDIEIIDIIEPNYGNELFRLAKHIQRISMEFKINVFTCAEMIDLEQTGIKHGSCIDIELIRNLFNIEKVFPKDKNQRKECLCGESVAMGVYDTCKYQCNYCYANSSPKMIQNNIKRHKIDNPTLIGLDLSNIGIQPCTKDNSSKKKQLSFL
jgi:DNA repair photolyase